MRALAGHRLLLASALLAAACDPSAAFEAVQAAREATGRAERRSPRAPSEPIPAGGPIWAASEDVRILKAWYERTFVDGYRRVGRRNPKWDKAAEAFIRDSGPRFLGLAAEAGTELKGRGREILQSGCDDPVVMYFAARALMEDESDSREISDLLEQATAAFADVPYPRVVARLAAARLRIVYDRQNEGKGKRTRLQPVELRWFLESLKDGSYAKDDDVVLLWHLTEAAGGEAFFDRNRAAVVAAVETTEWVDPWLRHLLAGTRSIKDAWDSRGTTFANKVKPEGWKGFAESVAAARESLTESYRLRPDRPEAAARMIVVALASSDSKETERLWFDRAVAAQLDHLRAYRALINALRTRWGGDPDALLAFARECADTRRFDTEVPMMAFEAIEQMEDDRVDEATPDEPDPSDGPPAPLPPSPYRDEEVYRLISTMLERYRRDPAVVRWQRYASLSAVVAYKAGRYDVARDTLEDLGGVLDQEARDAVPETMLEARIEANASPAGDEIRKAEALYLARRTAEALALFQAARPRVAAPALPYLDERIAAATLEKTLQSGKTVSFLPAPGLTGWSPRIGEWKVEKDGALVGTSEVKGLLIGADGRVGPDFEIEADIEIASTSNGQFQVGIVFGPELTFERQVWSSFRIKRTSHEGDVVYFSKHFGAPVHVIKRTVALKSHLLLQSWDGRLWAYIDGDPVVTDYAPEWKPRRTAEAMVGFGGYSNENVVVVRYRNVRLRRLTAAPAAPALAQAQP
jgi:hypothetical protein